MMSAICISCLILLFSCITIVNANNAISKKKCQANKNQVKLLVEYGTVNAFPDRSVEAEDGCACGDIGVNFIWNSSNNIVNDINYEYWKNNTPRYFVHTRIITITNLAQTSSDWRSTSQIYAWSNPRYAAFVLESGYTNYCKNICICTIEDECYTFSNSYGYVELVPYCQDGECYMYAITYRNDSITMKNFNESNLYGQLQNENGILYEFPAPFNASLGIDSPYLKVNRISCNGCEKIKNTKCLKHKKEAAVCNYTDYIGLTITVPMYFNMVYYMKPVSAKCLCDNGIRYLWEIPMPSNDKYELSAMNNTTIVNETILQLDYCDRLTMSIKTIDGNCYEDTDRTKTYYSVTIVLICPDFYRNNCSIQAIIDATSIVNIYNKSEHIPSQVTVDSISCLGCGAIMNDKHKCYKDIEASQDAVELLQYPTLNYSHNKQNYTLLDVVTQEYIDMPSQNMMSLISWFCTQAYLNYTLFDANLFEICKQSAYAKYGQYVSGGFDLMMYYDRLDLDLFNMSFNLKLVFGIPAILLTILVITLILRYSFLHTSYGIICVFIACIDLLLLIDIVVAETVYDIGAITMNSISPTLAEYTSLAENTSVVSFSIFGLGIDVFTNYIFAFTMATSVFLGTLKSFQRFLAIYAQYFYNMHITNKLTIKITITFIVILFIAFLPILILQKIGIIYIYYSYGWYYYGVGVDQYEATILIKYIRDYWEYGNILVSLILDIATAIKLFYVHRKSPEEWTKEKATIERLFVMQNFANASIFVAYFITYFTFVFLCYGGSAGCMTNFPQRFIIMFYSSNASRVIWVFFDELITLLFQLRAYKILKASVSSSAQ